MSCSFKLAVRSVNLMLTSGILLHPSAAGCHIAYYFNCQKRAGMPCFLDDYASCYVGHFIEALRPLVFDSHSARNILEFSYGQSTFRYSNCSLFAASICLARILTEISYAAHKNLSLLFGNFHKISRSC